MKIAALLYILQLSTTNYYDNSGCQLLIKQLNNTQQKMSSWSSILSIAKNLKFNYANNQTCKEKITGENIELQVQVIYGNKYIWHQEKSCIQFIDPENKILTNRESAIFTCLTNDMVLNQENISMDWTKQDQYTPEENKCGSTYYYAEIVDNKVVYKDSCGNIIKGPDFK